jgi:hypothetical protein
MADDREFRQSGVALVDTPVNVIRAVVGIAMADGSLSAETRSFFKGCGDAIYAGYGMNDHHRELGSGLEPMASEIEQAKDHYRDAPPLIPPKEHSSQDQAKDTQKAATVHGPREQPASQDGKAQGTVHGPAEEKTEKREGGTLKVDFGKAWDDRVAARREQASHDRKPEPEQGKDQAKQEQQHERSRRA